MTGSGSGDGVAGNAPAAPSAVPWRARRTVVSLTVFVATLAAGCGGFVAAMAAAYGLSRAFEGDALGDFFGEWMPMLGFVCAILFGWATVRGARLAGDLRVRHLLRTGTRLPGRVVDAVFGRTYNPRGPSRAFVDVTVAFDDGGPRTLSVRYVWWQPYDRITEEMRSRWFSMRSDRTPVTVVRGRHGGYATDLDRRRMAISSRW